MARSKKKDNKKKSKPKQVFPEDLGEVVENILRLQCYIIRLMRKGDKVYFFRSFGGNVEAEVAVEAVWQRLDRRKFCKADEFNICNIKEVRYCYHYMEGLHAVMPDEIIIKVSKSKKKRFRKKANACPTVTWGPPPKKAGM